MPHRHAQAKPPPQTPTPDSETNLQQNETIKRSSSHNLPLPPPTDAPPPLGLLHEEPPQPGDETQHGDGHDDAGAHLGGGAAAAVDAELGTLDDLRRRRTVSGRAGIPREGQLAIGRGGDVGGVELPEDEVWVELVICLSRRAVQRSGAGFGCDGMKTHR